MFVAIIMLDVWCCWSGRACLIEESIFPRSFLSQPSINFCVDGLLWYRKDTEHLYYAFVYLLIILLSSIYPFTQCFHWLLQLYVIRVFNMHLISQQKENKYSKYLKYLKYLKNLKYSKYSKSTTQFKVWRSSVL